MAESVSPEIQARVINRLIETGKGDEPWVLIVLAAVEGSQSLDDYLDKKTSVPTWVAPRAFADHFPNVTPDRFDEELGGIRGALLDPGQIGALADRLQTLLGPQPSAKMHLE